MKKLILILAAFAATGAYAENAVVKELQFDYQTKGAGPFTADAGKTMWTRITAREGKQRSCATCHNSDLKSVGKQANTGKPIKPLAPSANAERLTRKAEVEKWFNRNCKWTLGRACTPQEKGDFLAFIVTQ
jgi:formate-dependent nitrite reductase cytochrome c552 subunit